MAAQFRFVDLYGNLPSIPKTKVRSQVELDLTKKENVAVLTAIGSGMDDFGEDIVPEHIVEPAAQGYLENHVSLHRSFATLPIALRSDVGKLVSQSILCPNFKKLWINMAVTMVIRMKEGSLIRLYTRDLEDTAEEIIGSHLFSFSGVENLFLASFARDPALAFAEPDDAGIEVGRDYRHYKIWGATPLFLGETKGLDGSVPDLDVNALLSQLAAKDLQESTGTSEFTPTIPTGAGVNLPEQLLQPPPQPQNPLEKPANPPAPGLYSDAQETLNRMQSGRGAGSSTSRNSEEKDLRRSLDTKFEDLLRKLTTAYNYCENNDNYGDPKKKDLKWINRDLIKATMTGMEKAKMYSMSGSGPLGMLNLLDPTIQLTDVPKLPAELYLLLHPESVSSLTPVDRKTYFQTICYFWDHNDKVLKELSDEESYRKAINHYVCIGLCPEEWKSNIKTVNIADVVINKRTLPADPPKVLPLEYISSDIAKKGIGLMRIGLIVCVSAFAKCGRSSKISMQALRTLTRGINESSSSVAPTKDDEWMSTKNYYPYPEGANLDNIRDVIYKLSNNFLSHTDNLASAIILMTQLASMGGFSKALAARMDGLKSGYKIVIDHLSELQNIPNLLKINRREVDLCLKVAINISVNPFAYNRCWPLGRKYDETIENKDIADLYNFVVAQRTADQDSSLQKLRSSQDIFRKGVKGRKRAEAQIKIAGIKEHRVLVEEMADIKFVSVVTDKIKSNKDVMLQLERLKPDVSVLNPTGISPEVVTSATNLIDALEKAASDTRQEVDFADEARTVLDGVKQAVEVASQLASMLQTEEAKKAVKYTMSHIKGIFTKDAMSIEEEEDWLKREMSSEVSIV